MARQYNLKSDTDVAVEEEELSPAVKRAQARGYSGIARKINVQKVQGSESTVVQTYYAGILGPFTIRRGFDVILPEEAVEALRSANDATTVFSDFDHQGRMGHTPLVEIPVEPRFPFIDYGIVPWEDYEAFCAEQRKKPNLPTNR
jgi:hypothetical protein